MPSAVRPIVEGVLHNMHLDESREVGPARCDVWCVLGRACKRCAVTALCLQPQCMVQCMLTEEGRAGLRRQKHVSSAVWPIVEGTVHSMHVNERQEEGGCAWMQAEDGVPALCG